MDPVSELFSHSPWSNCLSPDQRERTLKSLYAKSYAAGETICRKGAISNVWIGIAKGLIRLGIESKQGKQLSLATGIPPGSWFGEGSLLKKEPRKYNVVALRKSTIVFMPEEIFFELLNENFAFNRFLLIQINEKVGSSSATWSMTGCCLRKRRWRSHWRPCSTACSIRTSTTN